MGLKHRPAISFAERLWVGVEKEMASELIRPRSFLERGRESERNSFWRIWARVPFLSSETGGNLREVKRKKGN